MKTGGRFLAAGLVLGGMAPAVALFAITIHEYFGCNTHRTEGCLNIGWLGLLGKSALSVSFITVPLGLVLCVIGLIWMIGGLLTIRRSGQEGNYQGISGFSEISAARQQPKAPFPWWSLVRLVFEWILGAAAMVIFGAAAALPTRGRDAAIFWQIGAALGVLATLVFIIWRRRYAPLLLLASGMFFFTSCTANFHWGGG